MSRQMSVLEGAYRLTTINKAKRMVYVIQVLTMIGLTFLLLIYGGMSLQPFYMPLDSFVYFIIIMFMVLMVESLLFRVLEIRFTKSESKKFLMAKNSIRKAVTFMLMALIFAVLLLAPFTANTIEGTLGKDGEVGVGIEESIQIQSRDLLGLTRLESITLTMAPTVRGHAYLLTEEQFTAYSNGNEGILNESLRRSIMGSAVSFENFPASFVLYHLLILSPINPDAVVSVSIRTSPSPTFFTLVPVLLLVMVGVSIANVVYMTPLKREYAAGSIYR